MSSSRFADRLLFAPLDRSRGLARERTSPSSSSISKPRAHLALRSLPLGKSGLVSAARLRVAFALGLICLLVASPLAAQPSAAFPDEPHQKAPPPARARPPAPSPAPRAPAPASARPSASPPPPSAPTPRSPPSAPAPASRPPAVSPPASPPPPRAGPGPASPTVTTPQASRTATSPPALTLAQLPPALPAYGDLEPPPGYVVKSRPDSAAIVSGSIVFGVSYTAGIIAGTFDKSGAGSLAFIPLFGPWVAIGEQDFTCTVEANEASIENCQTQVVAQAAVVATYAAVGVAQILGVASIVRGLVDRERVWVRQDLVGSGPTRMSVLPYASVGSAGLTFRGSF